MPKFTPRATLKVAGVLAVAVVILHAYHAHVAVQQGRGYRTKGASSSPSPSASDTHATRHRPRHATKAAGRPATPHHAEQRRGDSPHKTKHTPPHTPHHGKPHRHPPGGKRPAHRQACTGALLSDTCPARLPREAATTAASGGGEAGGAVIIEAVAGDVAQARALDTAILRLVGGGGGGGQQASRLQMSPGMEEKLSAQAAKMQRAVAKEKVRPRRTPASPAAAARQGLATVACLTAAGEGQAGDSHPHHLPGIAHPAVATPRGSVLAPMPLCDAWDALQCQVSPAAGPHPLVEGCPDFRAVEAQLIPCTGVDLSVERVVVLGGKTALYRGGYRGSGAGIKHFTEGWYASFAGFHLFASHTRVRHPLINYPMAACEYEGTVLQPQPFLKGRDLKHWRASKEAKHLGWGERLVWALRMACMHVFLHEGHPQGPFTFDDNHPGQYFITAEGPVMIDIDTIQKAGPGNTTRCRCFGCNGGRANCQFVNSPEGYRHCGVGNSRRDTGVPAETCGTATDIWFLGQLLQMLLPDGKASIMEKYGTSVGQEVMKGTLPNLHDAGEPGYVRIVRACLSKEMASRPRASEVVSQLLDLCDKHSCGFDECPALYYDDEGYIDSVPT